MGVRYEGNGYASLDFLTWITALEIVLLVLSFCVLGIAFLMFARLFDALSPPTKALTYVVGGNVVLALLLLAFACFQMYYYTREEFIPQGGAFCAYVNPVVLALIVFGWVGQPLIAWTTLKTLRNEEVPDQQLRRLFYGGIGVAVLDYIWGVIMSPGRIVNGAFCVMVPSATDAIDARAFANAVGVLTFLASVVMYTKSFCVLWGLRRMLVRNVKRSRVAHELMAAAEEGKEAANELSSMGHASSSRMSMSRSYNGPWSWREGDAGSAFGRDEELGAGGRGGPGLYYSSDEDSDDDTEDSEEGGEVFTYEELQRRTQAARAAVNILLPNRVDYMAAAVGEGREGHYGRRRRQQQERLPPAGQEEGGVDLSALMDSPGGRQQPQRSATAAFTNETGGGQEQQQQPPSPQQQAGEGKQQPRSSWRRRLLGVGRWRAEENDPYEESLRLCNKAMLAVVGRSAAFLAVYYLPSYILFGTMGIYEDYRPPADILPIYALVFFLGTPVLQTITMLHVAVTTGSNILHFYWHYAGGGGRVEAGAQGVEERFSAMPAAPVVVGELEVGEKGLAAAAVPPVARAGEGNGGFLYEQGTATAAAAAAAAAVVAEGGADAEAPAATTTTAPEQQQSQGSPPRPVGAATPQQRPMGPLGVPQPSAFHRGRYGGRKVGVGGMTGPQHMQALSTIYEVAFKSRGRDAAAALRHSKETAASKKSASNKAAAAAAANEKEAESDKEAGGGEKEEKGPQVEEEGDTGDVSSMAPALSVLSSKMASLQQNKLLQEMLGVKVRRSSTSSSSISSVSTSSSASAHSFSGGSATSSLSGNSNDGGHNNGKTMPRHAWQPSAGAFFPWRPRSRPMSLADDSEISSLTDAQDYQQVGSLASSLGGSPVRVFRPGSGAVVAAGGKGLLGPFAAHAVGGEESEDLGATSLDPPSSGGDSVDSWQEDARGGGGSVVSGSSGGSSSYNTGSLVSDGGRSIVTESDWKEWCHMKGAVVTGGVGGKEGQGAVLTPLPSLAVEVGDGDRTTNAQ